MNEPLAKQTCSACRPDAPRVTPEEQTQLIKAIPQWKIISENNIAQLSRTFKFPNYTLSLAFTNQIAALAEQANHHPQLTLNWGAVTLHWWTHKIKGLHKNDFIMAARTDQTYELLQSFA